MDSASHQIIGRYVAVPEVQSNLPSEDTFGRAIGVSSREMSAYIYGVINVELRCTVVSLYSLK